MASLGFFAFLIFATGHVYKLAVKGEFKKAELEKSHYLCESVTNAVEKNGNRIDKALALYLADEISKPCLESEIDFVLWTQDESSKAWAYLAKGFLKADNTEEFEEYLNKTCDIESEGDACLLALYKADPEKNKMPEGSETSGILQVTEDFENGQYRNAEKKFRALALKNGYETFSQQGLIKSLWAQNKLERARGALQSSLSQLTTSQQLSLSAWVCHEEMDRKCSQEAIEACEDLKTTTAKTKSSHIDTFVALALIREKECRQTGDLNLLSFHHLLQEKKDFASFVQVISSESNLNSDEKTLVLKDLAFRKESVRPQFIRTMALQKWAEVTKDEEQLGQIAEFLKSHKIRGLSWVKVYQRTLQSLLKSGSTKHLKELAELPSKELVQTYQLQNLQLQAHYLAQNYEKAWQELRGLKQNTARSPASTENNLKAIEQFLESKFKSPEGEQ